MPLSALPTSSNPLIFLPFHRFKFTLPAGSCPEHLHMLTSVCLPQETSLDLLLLRHTLRLPPPLPRQNSWKCCQHSHFPPYLLSRLLWPAFPHPRVEGEWLFAQGGGKVWFSVLKFCGFYNIPAQIESRLVPQITWLTSLTLGNSAVDTVSPLCVYVTPTTSVRRLCDVLFASSPLLWEASSSLASVLLHS